MGYFKNQEIKSEDEAIQAVAPSHDEWVFDKSRRDYCHEECLDFAKWAKRNEDEMYSRYLRLEQRWREEFEFYDYLQIMWERQRHQDDPIIPS